MWLLRVAVAAVGVPYATGTWLTSLSILAALLALYTGYRAPSSGLNRYGQAAVAGIVLAAAVTLLVIYGIAVTAGLGIPSYIHAPGEGFQPEGISPARHMLGHLSVFPVAAALTTLLALIGLGLGRRSATAPVGGARPA
jgi:hypothetical protein